jgi:hypothetical protein
MSMAQKSSGAKLRFSLATQEGDIKPFALYWAIDGQNKKQAPLSVRGNGNP